MIHIIRNHTLNASNHYDEAKFHLDFVVDFYSKIFEGISTSKARTRNSMSNLIFNKYKIEINKNTFKSLVSIVLKKDTVDKFYASYVFEFISILKLFDSATLKKLIEGLPGNDPASSFISVEKELLSKIQKISPKLIDVEFGSGNLIMKSGLRKITDKIFDYSIFEGNGLITSKSKKRYNLYNALEKLDVRSCPYCNRQFTFTVLSEVKGKRKILVEEHIKPEIDHFYPQKYHPLLAISYYNLIPSCGTCNKAKLDMDIKPEKYIHPFIEGFEDDALFFNMPLSYKEIKGYSASGVVRLIVDTKDKLREDRINENIAMFKLDKIYQAHSDYASEIVKTKDELGGSYLDHVKKIFLARGIIKTEAEIYKIAYSNYFERKDFDKRILSKLIYDISIMAV